MRFEVCCSIKLLSSSPTGMDFSTVAADVRRDISISSRLPACLLSKPNNNFRNQNQEFGLTICFGTQRASPMSISGMSRGGAQRPGCFLRMRRERSQRISGAFYMPLYQAADLRNVCAYRSPSKQLISTYRMRSPTISICSTAAFENSTPENSSSISISNSS